MASTQRVVVTDTNILINFIHVGRLDLLGKLPGYEFVVPEQVVLEITEPNQVEALQVALDAGFITHESMSDPAELTLYAQHQKIMGRGEAACLALAEHRGWLVAGDEKGVFLRTAEQRLGACRLLNTYSRDVSSGYSAISNNRRGSGPDEGDLGAEEVRDEN